MNTDVSQIHLGDIAVDVVLKDIKNVHLSVHPPTGRVRISAPKRMRIDTIRVFAISKLAWIKQQQRKLREQERETPREYVERESHCVWGRRFLLTVVEGEGPPSIEVKHSRLLLQVPPRTGEDRRQTLVEAWYREQLKEAVPPLLVRWQQLLAVSVQRFFVQRMKTRWGSCNSRTGSIRLNTASVDVSKPAINRRGKTGNFAGGRDQWSSTSSPPRRASRSGLWCASCAVRT